ncbi:hypothetical protein QFZ77_006187 [Paenibacillus sp. V4I3]|uniref:hypothetical protein n=1 Tax=unclassified Paenibacillus TaxID=185978 RepID=UPI002785024D|nr:MULTISPECIES: hypothetical protein [unclassified Paenibacillus]MDQ0877528.1 hypothetical protein [Paenibacillus sp. V4I3]MDQ0886606.1 hypothetical protein [Paenibacillus sp. V4I9]
MRMTIENNKEDTFVYLYFYDREDCILLNNGGESDKNCYLLFDHENEWVGLSIESDFNVRDLTNLGKGFIKRTSKEWLILFNKEVQFVRREKHGCLTDLHNTNYTGIELILLKTTITNRKYTTELL